jgi:hypothetical protein
MARAISHEGTVSRWHGTYTTFCGITVALAETTKLWFTGKPSCAECLRYMARRR